MPAVSCSTASCAKMPSRLGSDMSTRSRSMESSATTRPLCRMMTRAETRSTVSSSWELNSTVLPRAASSAMSPRSTSAELTSRPENGSSSSTRSGIVEQRGHQQHLLAHAFRIRRDGHVAVFVKREQAQERIDLFRQRACRQAAQLPHHLQVFAAGEMRIEVRLFGHVAQAAAIGHRVASGCARRQTGFRLRWARCRPVIILSVVDLPEPFGPR